MILLSLVLSSITASNWWIKGLGLVGIGYFCTTTLFTDLPNAPKNACQSQIVIEKVRAGGNQQHEVINSVDNLAKKEYFKEMLVKHFPDFESRSSLEKGQAIIYRKAIKRLKEYQRISPLLKNHQKWLTAEEKSSIDYFHGTGIYAKFQDPKTPPNINDTRKTFLKKIENK